MGFRVWTKSFNLAHLIIVFLLILGIVILLISQIGSNASEIADKIQLR